MGRICKTCESTDFAVESCETVCTTCGEVQEDLLEDDGDLKTIPDGQTMIDSHRSKKHEAYDRLTNRIRGETSTSDTRRQIIKEKLLDEMRRAVKKLIKHPCAIDETMDLVTATFQAYQGRLLTSRKYGLVGACIYYLSAKHQLGISLNDICKEFGIRMKVISVCLKQVKNLSPDFEYERPNIKDLVKKYIDEMAAKHYSLSSLESAASPLKKCKQVTISDESGLDTQPLIDSKDKIVLQNRVMLLLDLFEAMHPYNQPAPQSLITAVIYHAWRSLDTFKMLAINLKKEIPDYPLASPEVDDPNECRDLAIVITEDSEEQLQRRVMTAKHSISYEKFCQLCNLKYSSNNHKIVCKLQASLLMLGKYLGNVNKMNLPWYLKDIIDNSPHLIQEHMRTDTSKVASKMHKSVIESNQIES